MTNLEWAEKLTDDWWDYLKRVNQLDTEIENLDHKYWEWLEDHIAAELDKRFREGEMTSNGRSNSELMEALVSSGDWRWNGKSWDEMIGHTKHLAELYGTVKDPRSTGGG